MSTLQKKINISFSSACLFFVINLPQTYKLTSTVLNNNNSNNVTYNGLLLHTLIFFLISYFTMGDKPAKLKLKYSFYGTLIFYFFSSSPLYCITNKIVNKTSQEQNVLQVMIHSVLYFATLLGVMYLPDKKTYK